MIQKNIALLSPNKNAYSETFIQQHRTNLKGNIVFYFKGSLPKENDIEGKLLNRLFNVVYKLKLKLNLTKLTVNENALIKSFKKQKIQVVVAEYGTTGVAVLRVCKQLKLPLIPIFHGYDASVNTVLENNKENYKVLFEYAYKIIVVSNKIAETLIKMGCNSEKIVVTPCAPNDLFFKITPSFKKPLFIAVGRFVDKKAPYYTILSFYKILEKFPNSKLIIAGNGPLFNTCQNLVKHLGISNNVKLPGVIKPEKIAKHFNNALAFVQHSVTANNGDMEGTPVAVLEASASGLPVISTFHAGIPDVIINGTTGLLCKEHDVETMANNMLQLLENKELAITMGKTGKKNIKENFSLKRHIDVLQEIITKAI